MKADKRGFKRMDLSAFIRGRIRFFLSFTGRGLFVSYRNAAQSVPGTMRIEGPNRRLSLHWTSLGEGNANFSIVIVFRYADDLMVMPESATIGPEMHSGNDRCREVDKSGDSSAEEVASGHLSQLQLSVRATNLKNIL
jgi:hypothetical protein